MIPVFFSAFIASFVVLLNIVIFFSAIWYLESNFDIVSGLWVISLIKSNVIKYIAIKLCLYWSFPYESVCFLSSYVISEYYMTLGFPLLKIWHPTFYYQLLFVITFETISLLFLIIYPSASGSASLSKILSIAPILIYLIFLAFISYSIPCLASYE